MNTSEQIKIEIAKSRAVLQQQQQELADTKRSERAYRHARDVEICRSFRVDLECMIPVKTPQVLKDNLFDHAWMYGHSAGYDEVRLVYENLIEKFIVPIEYMFNEHKGS